MQLPKTVSFHPLLTVLFMRELHDSNAILREYVDCCLTVFVEMICWQGF
jgi:hypothetical protein